MARLRARVARLERRPPPASATILRFGIPAIDAALPGGGLHPAALHELAQTGPGLEHATLPALLLAGLLARRPGPVLWALARADIHPPALAAAGLHPDRVIFAEAGRHTLAVMEEGLHHPGLAAVVGEVGALSLTASRRLQLAAEATATPAFALRRFPLAADPALHAPNAAVTRWRLAPLPAPPPLPAAPGIPGLAPPRWRLDLVRCRGGAPATWTVEACDASGRLDLAPLLPDRPAAPPARRATG